MEGLHAGRQVTRATGRVRKNEVAGSRHGASCGKYGASILRTNRAYENWIDCGRSTVESGSGWREQTRDGHRARIARNPFRQTAPCKEDAPTPLKMYCSVRALRGGAK